jgi:arabinogalactan oligomer/maltooligosaccharide transport system permease protein
MPPALSITTNPQEVPAMVNKERRWAPYAYLAPALVSITFLTIFPLIFTVVLAFTDANLVTFNKGTVSFIGLQNFVELLQGGFADVFFPVFGWNILYALACVVTQFSLGLAVALLLNNPHMRESNFYRAILILPWAIPGNLAIIAWTGLFQTTGGTINVWLHNLFGISPIPWLQDPNLAKVAVLIVNLWLGFPWFMTVSLGALQSIPTEMYEAADIDGASKWVKFSRLTMPLLFRVAAPLLISSFATNFNGFNTAFLLVNGGPSRPGPYQAGYTDILASVGYKLTVSLNRYGLSAALSVILFFIVAGISILNMKLTGAFGQEEEA